MCYSLDLNSNLSLAFKELFNNLADYNTTWDINRTNQVTILCK